MKNLLLLFALIFSTILLFIVLEPTGDIKAKSGNLDIVYVGKIADAAHVTVGNAIWTGKEIILTDVFTIRDEKMSMAFLKFDPQQNSTEKILELDGLSDRKAAVWMGEEILIFGGTVTDGAGRYLPTDQIVSFNPETYELKVLNVTLPYPTADISAVWAGEYAYLFMKSENSDTPEVWRFDPKKRLMEKLNVDYPEGFDNPGFIVHSAVWFDGSIFLFYKDRVARFNPSEGSFVWLETRLPTKQPDAWARAAVATDDGIYVIGGSNGFTNFTDEIIRFDPETGNAEVTKSRLPTPRGGAVEVWDGRYVYVVGGWSGGVYLNEILRFDYRMSG
ncbi:hypothetical protein [Geoglobus ahangari]